MLAEVGPWSWTWSSRDWIWYNCAKQKGATTAWQPILITEKRRWKISALCIGTTRFCALPPGVWVLPMAPLHQQSSYAYAYTSMVYAIACVHAHTGIGSVHTPHTHTHTHTHAHTSTGYSMRPGLSCLQEAWWSHKGCAWREQAILCHWQLATGQGPPGCRIRCAGVLGDCHMRVVW